MPPLLGHEGPGYKIRGDLNRLPFRDGAFDLVTANMVVEHVKGSDMVMSETRRVLRSRGGCSSSIPLTY